MSSRSNPHQEELFKLAQAGDLVGIQQLFRDVGKDDSVHINLYARDRDHDRSALHWAVAEGHHPVVAYLIEIDSSIGRAGPLDAAFTDDAASPMLLDILDQPDHDDETMLFRSVENRDVELARILLRHGAAVNVTCGGLGISPLHSAVMVQQIAMVELLMAYNADVNAKDSEGCTPLMQAIVYQVSANIVTVLLEKGVDVDVNTADDDGNTALHFAVMYGRTEVCALLLAHNANVNAKDREGRTPLMQAVAYQVSANIIGLILEKGVDVDVNTADDDGNTALHFAVVYERTEVCALLLAYNVDVNAKDRKGRTPLMQAVAYHVSTNIVTVLLERGDDVDVNAADDDGNTALHFAAMHGRADVRALLLAHNANVNAKDRQGCTPLSEAVTRERSGIVRVFLEKGVDVDVNTADNNGNTALHFAVMYERTEVCALLLAHNANVNAKNSEGCTPLIQAVTRGESGIVRVLLEKGVDVDVNTADNNGNTALHFAVMYERTEVCALLLAHNANVNAKNSEGCTPLSEAVTRGESGIVRVLFEKGADVDVNTADNNGDTALHFAAMHGRTEVCALLLAHNADVNAKNSEGCTTLIQAVVFQVSADIVRVLLEKGDDVDVNIADDEGYTPLYYAEKYRKHDIIEYLIRWQTGPATDNSPSSSER